LRHDRIDSPRRQTPSRPHARALLAVFSPVLIFLLVSPALDDSLLISGVLFLPFLGLVLRLARNSIHPPWGSVRQVSSVFTVTGLPVAESLHWGEGANSDADPASPHDFDGIEGSGSGTGSSDPAGSGLEPSAATGTDEAKTKRRPGKGPRKRRRLPDPSPATWVTVAPGRYVRVEEAEPFPAVDPDVSAEDRVEVAIASESCPLVREVIPNGGAVPQAGEEGDGFDSMLERSADNRPVDRSTCDEVLAVLRDGSPATADGEANQGQDEVGERGDSPDHGAPSQE
jgi:hypothetical protein